MKKIIGLVILYIIAFALMVAGVFCGLQLYKEIKAESYVNGSIDISNRFSQESFKYTATSVVFYHDLYDDTDTYYFEKELLKTENFDGANKKYNVLRLRSSELRYKSRLGIRYGQYGFLRYRRAHCQQRGNENIRQVFKRQNTTHPCNRRNRKCFVL